jgi:pyruvate,water dikinase
MTAPPLTLTLAEVNADALAWVGGKGANLGALTRAGVRVPPGYCVTTSAYDRFLAALPDADALFAALDALDGTSIDAARTAAESLRRALDALAMPADVAVAVTDAWRALGTEHPLAVRSSATAEDLPGASFAGQQDTYLNVIGEAALLDAVRRCWISLFTDRAVLYRARNAFGHRGVRLAVVVQRLVEPEVSGILFTADPTSGHRQIASIDAGFGLGEALVSGLISADLYRVDRRRGSVLLARPGDKAFAIRSVPGGGTRREPLSEVQRHARALDDQQVLALAEIGARVEAHFDGVPQDIEWCIANGETYVVQARPITTLYPIPIAPRTDRGLRVFLSFGHFQMMHDAMPRLALEIWRYFFPAGKDHAPAPGSAPVLSRAMVPAGGRLFVDATLAMRVRPMRHAFIAALSHVYEALGQSMAVLTARPELRDGPVSVPRVMLWALRIVGPVLARVPAIVFVRNSAAGATRFTRAVEEIPREARARIAAGSTPGDRIRACAAEMNAIFWRVRRYLPWLGGGVIAHRLLTRLVRGAWADGVRDDVDVLLRGLRGNVTTEMDLAVGDLADLVRPHAALRALLVDHSWAEIVAQIDGVEGGPEFRAALQRFLARYGDRSASEIDASRPRWRDDPALLLRTITGGLAAGEIGAHRRKHEAQVAAGDAAASRLVAAAGRGFVGLVRGRLVARLVRVVRLGLALREHPKFIVIQILGTVRVEIVAAGELLASRGQLADATDVWHLGWDELARSLDDPKLALRDLVTERASELRRDRTRRPPIAISSDGEIPTIDLAREDTPAGALAGTAASAGVVEGIARVVLDPQRETLHAGEILVAPFTDPGWTPLFVNAAAIVTEVGGLMTHGAVVAREYGIPAVVSVAGAVERIRSGQRIRVDGTRGFVEILASP